MKSKKYHFLQSTAVGKGKVLQVWTFLQRRVFREGFVIVPRYFIRAQTAKDRAELCRDCSGVDEGGECVFKRTLNENDGVF